MSKKCQLGRFCLKMVQKGAKKWHLPWIYRKTPIFVKKCRKYPPAGAGATKSSSIANPRSNLRIQGGTLPPRAGTPPPDPHFAKKWAYMPFFAIFDPPKPTFWTPFSYYGLSKRHFWTPFWPHFRQNPQQTPFFDTFLAHFYIKTPYYAIFDPIFDPILAKIDNKPPFLTYF